jgi:hypothetical protein
MPLVPSSRFLVSRFPVSTRRAFQPSFSAPVSTYRPGSAARSVGIITSGDDIRRYTERQECIPHVIGAVSLERAGIGVTRCRLGLLHG